MDCATAPTRLRSAGNIDRRDRSGFGSRSRHSSAGALQRFSIRCRAAPDTLGYSLRDVCADAETALAGMRRALAFAGGCSMNKDELEGKAEALKGKVKQAVGDATDNPDLVDEGTADEAAGKTQDTFGRARRKVGEAINDVGDAIKK
jgi:uncharacterized protein YjbJ (UPF0337 family)